MSKESQVDFEQEEVDLEAWAKAHPSQRPPRCRTFRIRVDNERFRVQDSAKTGREILSLVGLAPDGWSLAQKFPGGRREPIEPDQLVDFRRPGIERFESSPKQVQAGSSRQFELPTEDVEFLNALGLPWDAVKDGNGQGVIIREYPMPAGLAPTSADLLIRVPPHYSVAQLDMMSLSPAVRRTDGRTIDRLTNQPFAGRMWQQWSRHRTGDQKWRAGVDNFSTHLRFVEFALKQDAAAAA